MPERLKITEVALLVNRPNETAVRQIGQDERWYKPIKTVRYATIDVDFVCKFGMSSSCAQSINLPWNIGTLTLISLKLNVLLTISLPSCRTMLYVSNMTI